jgi:hypothetical protein
MADNGTLTIRFFFNIARQARTPASTIASVDALICYNRIAHAIALLVFQAIGVPELATGSMLGMIENVKFFLHTRFGTLKDLPLAKSV